MKGQKFFTDKYDKDWDPKQPLQKLSGRKRLAREDGVQSTRGRKRVKFSNKETILEAYPHLQPYENQRSLEFLGPSLFQNSLKKIENFDVKPCARQAGVSSKFLRDKQSTQSAHQGGLQENEVSIGDYSQNAGDLVMMGSDDPQLEQ